MTKLLQVSFVVIYLLEVYRAQRIVQVHTNAVEISGFPKDFLFGSASAAYQIEGAWDRDGRLPSIWDDLTHNHPELVFDHATGDITSNSYDLYLEDVKAMKEVGFDFYRFSVSWSRILPTGDISSLNEKGIAYYNRLIDALVAEGIQPVITMYHWDLPLALQTNLGGMVNPLIVDYFKVYADILFSRFGDRVKHWITVNEPIVFCTGGYANGAVAPLVYYPGVGEYLCAHHVLLSHAAIHELYGSKYRATQNGKIGISLSSPYFYTQKPDGSAANTGPVIDRGLQYLLGWFAHPIFSKTGGYPQVMVTEIANNSAAEGRPWSRLPILTPDQQKQIQGSADFLGLNYYTSSLVEKIDPPASDPPSWGKDQALAYHVNASWPVAKSSWLYSVPEGLGDLLRWINKEYDNPEVWITENGWSDDGTLEDVGRIKYVRDHLAELQKAMVEDGCNVKAYTIWSLIDNFEWLRGYSEKFGLYFIDFASEAKTRVPKKSVEFFKDLLSSRTIPDPQ